ncbi:hypothetical protein ABB37_04950 [Leptomonas pyrrhocoris]|uniref:Uncharacterized protein n=1 Tax=Leptomonas pyrrhocoris TaxID=157538 RepID=A0A0N0VF27_LEPPY|nr:hypothetical protein ABB37_04950 [Leptomonas pyrrhocoris]KPA79878.1 hypothetical protein ABB37_04950 [Leptomonas pyrrhocoris]|eukprot:XP_015658317.1 hypothetical protein ABB37_04950 [Leptomonas pyrrhocoris]
MYRETILGLALASTLAEMNPRLTARQEKEIWRVFDASMVSAVAEAPLMSHVSVHVPPPSSVAGGGMAAVSTAAPQLYVPAQAVEATEDVTPLATADVEQQHTLAASSPSPAVEAPFDDSNIAFPVYRVCDGVWTVLLKDPTVVVRDESGKSEQMQLDYLKVCLKDISATSGAAKSKKAYRKRAKKS